jgi:hypothetical protein
MATKYKLKKVWNSYNELYNYTIIVDAGNGLSLTAIGVASNTDEGAIEEFEKVIKKAQSDAEKAKEIEH